MPVHTHPLTGRYVITITLRDGTSHTETVDRMPRFWKSYLMHALPYGTPMQGCTFSRKVVK